MSFEEQFSILPLTSLDLGEWSEVYSKSGSKSPFYHPEYIRSLVLSASVPNNVVCVKGILNNQVSSLNLVQIKNGRFGVRSAGLWAFRGSDHIEPMATHPEITISELTKFLSSGHDLLEFRSAGQDFVAGLQASYPAYRFTLSKQTKCRYLDLPNSKNELLARFSSKTRNTIKRKQKRAYREGIRFVKLSNKQLVGGFSMMIDLHKQRLADKGLTSKLLDRAPIEFHRRLVSSATQSEQSIVRIFTAQKDGSIVGAFYGFEVRDTFYYFNSGFDPAFGKYSLGMLLMLECIEYSIENGLKRFDLLRGNEDYKSFWTKTYRHNFHGYLALTNKGLTKALALTVYKGIMAKLKK